MIENVFNPLTAKLCNLTTCQKYQDCLGVNADVQTNYITSLNYLQMTTGTGHVKAYSLL